jgi:HAD superfamily phosphoserine phosphatase-like hydrolase
MAFIATDLEGTLTTGATWRGFGNYLKQYRSALAYNLFLALRLPMPVLVSTGLLDQQRAKSAWIADQLKLFTDATVEDVHHMAEWVVEHEMWPRRRPAVLEEIEQHRVNGRRVILVTGTYQPIAEVFAARIGVEALGTPLKFVDGRLAGIDAAVSVKSTKADNLRAQIGDEPVLAAYGDTVSDIPMLEMAEHPTAVHPDKRLRAAADARGWRIID